jgi:two-component system, OmpR family, response regulator
MQGDPVPQTAHSAHGAQRVKRILVVEDDPSTAKEILGVLREHGFALDLASDGQQGLSRVLTGNYHAIVLDRMLPGVDGLSILSTARNVGIDTPVLLLSALDTVDERVRGLRVGGDDYLTKPFSFDELTARLGVLLRRRFETEHPSLLRVGDLVLDTAAQTVQRDGAEIELKPRELALLEFLMRHAEQIVTRALLFESVWNYHHSVQTNVIDVHIGQLRRKITLDGKLPPMIFTVHGSGYILRGSD